MRAVPKLTGVLAACIGACAGPGAAFAKDEPLWEFGLGAGAVAFEDYRGSNTVHAYPVPVPYFLYNGKFLKADREGVRGTLFNQDRLEINLSFNLTTPVRNDRIRSGMPDLRSTVEAGPSFDLHLFRSDDEKIKFDLRMPSRAAMTVEASPKIIGWTFTPRFNLDIGDPFGVVGWNLGLLAGPLFADRRYENYFYSVAPQFATATRPEFQASGGYAGTETLAALSRRFPKFWLGAYMRYDSLAGASFIDSPLVQTRRYWTAGFGFAYMLRQSARMVQAPD